MLSLRQRVLPHLAGKIRMSSSISQECPCPPHRSDASPNLLKNDEIADILPKLDSYKQRENSIERLYTFKGFRGAIKFVTTVADECVKHNVSESTYKDQLLTQHSTIQR